MDASTHSTQISLPPTAILALQSSDTSEGTQRHDKLSVPLTPSGRLARMPEDDRDRDERRGGRERESSRERGGGRERGGRERERPREERGGGSGRDGERRRDR